MASTSTNSFGLALARGAAMGIAALAVLKYVVIALEEGGIANAPHFFLLLPLLLIVAAMWARGSNIGGLIFLVIMLIVVALVTASAIVRLGFSQQNWADAVIVFVGLPLSLLGLYGCLRARTEVKGGASEASGV